MAIQTPSQAQKVEDFTPTQIDQIKKGWLLYGSNVIQLTYSGGQHVCSIVLYEGSSFNFKLANELVSGDIIKDFNDDEYTVIIKGAVSSFNNEWIIKATISGTEITVNSYYNYDQFEFIAKFGSTGTGDELFNFPSGVSVYNDRIYVSNVPSSGVSEVQIFDINGVFISRTQHTHPYTNFRDLYVYSDRIYVIDNVVDETDDCRIYDLNMSFITSFSYGLDGALTIKVYDDLIYIGSDDDTNIKVFTLAGVLDDTLTTSLETVAIDVYNDLVYSGNSNNTVTIYNLTGTLLTTFGSSGSGDGQFLSISSVKVYNDRIFIVDNSRDDIQVFDLLGNFILKFNESSVKPEVFNTPYRLDVYNGRMYLTDTANDNVQIFLN